MLDRDIQYRLTQSFHRERQNERLFQIESFHDQLPLAVPCYDLVPVIEFTFGPNE